MKRSLAFFLVFISCGGPPPVPEPPAPNTSAMESQVAEAIESARHGVIQSSGSSDSWSKLGMVLQAHALYPEAIECYQQAMEIAPRDGRWPYLAALSQRKVELAGAVQYFEKAAEFSPRHAALHVNFGNTLLQLGKFERAQAQYEKALNLESTSTHALYGLAQVALNRDQSIAALELLRTAAELAPRHGEVQALLAQVHHQRGENEEAGLAELRAKAWNEATRAPDPVAEAMQEHAVTTRSFTERGLRLARQNHFAAAEEAFRRVLEIRPGNARDHANHGGALARQGKLDEAVAVYQDALEVDPEDPWTRNNLGMALADKGNLDHAVAQLVEAIRLDASYADAYNNLGLLLSRQQRFDEAIEHFAKALEINPALTTAHVQMGTALAARDRLGEAIGHWRRAVDLDQQELSAVYNLCVALAQRGEHQEAITRLRRGLRIAPNSSRLVSLLAWELATAPDDFLRGGNEALSLARRIHEALPQQASASDVFAAALAETGDFEAAVQIARQGLQLARASKQTQIAQQIQQRLVLYEKRRPYRQGFSTH